jgi:membrane-bound inhibitor of C-type lysozyme
MTGRFVVLLICAATCMGAANPASAQTFRKYQCQDGAEFALAVFDSRRMAFVQLDGRRYSLPQRIFAVPGRKRYSKSGVSISTKGDTAILRRAGKRSDCAVAQTY